MPQENKPGVILVIEYGGSGTREVFDRDIVQALCRVSTQTGVNLFDLVRAAITDWLVEHGKDRPLLGGRR